MATGQMAIVRRKVNSPLLDYKSDVTSQCGEDGIIAHVCDVIEPANRYCIEFGAWDGKLYSKLDPRRGYGPADLEGRHPLSSADFQVLPESLRTWGDAQKK